MVRVLIRIRFPPLKVHGVDVYILFLETALVSMCISLKSYSMEINNFFFKSAHITRGVGQYEHVV